MANYKKYSDLGSDKKEEVDDSLIIKLLSKDHKKKLIETNKVVVFDIYSDTCTPCKLIAPRFAALAKEYHPFVFVKEDAMQRFTDGVRGVPTFQYFYKGRMTGSTIGADMNEVKKNLDDLKKMVEQNM